MAISRFIHKPRQMRILGNNTNNGTTTQLFGISTTTNGFSLYNIRTLVIVFFASMIITIIFSSLRLTAIAATKRSSTAATALPTTTSHTNAAETDALYHLFVDSFQYFKPREAEEKHNLICLL